MSWPATIALPGVISSGTVNPDHVIPVLVETLNKIDPSFLESIVTAYPELTTLDTDSIEYGEVLSEYHMTLFAALEMVAPPGYWFGTNPHDPAELGFFEVEHVDYPHEPGRLYDCPACEAQCHCTPDTAECVYSGTHNPK